MVPQIELSLGLWQGSYNKRDRLWLRWMTLEGDLIPTLEEEAAAAKQRATNAEQRAINAEQEEAAAKQQATEAKKQNDRLVAKLRELGIIAEEFS
ncbi:MAG: hypothetical protein F6K22_07785 [Okeania sp. SIO2F4]|uniref:hypothetical protein n=1 Tax=Okeania sp. SIO2F4 TaxID=2607790 RepID=UPI00142AB6C7|nr:hypothetical protein [Okeania sp. SIO2F4]NES02757.1 hypothetical protein [Okeania sp. SIO2F4]